MKKVTNIMLCAVMVFATFALTSCEKEGVFKPKNKIAQIYTKIDGGEKALYQIYKWDEKSNLLSEVYNVNEDYAMHFVFDGKRIAQITTTDGNTATYEYDGKLLKSISMAYDNGTKATYEFTHDGKQIIRTDYSREGNLLGSQYSFTDFAFNFVNAEIAQYQCETANQVSSAKGSYSYTETYTYDGKNITQIDRHDSDNDDYHYTFTFNEDYLNPLHLFMDDYTSTGINKNMVKSYDYSNTKIESAKTHCESTFEGDGKYPTHETRVTAITHHVGSLDNTYTQTVEYFYEYIR